MAREGKREAQALVDSGCNVNEMIMALGWALAKQIERNHSQPLEDALLIAADELMIGVKNFEASLGD